MVNRLMVPSTSVQHVFVIPANAKVTNIKLLGKYLSKVKQIMILYIYLILKHSHSCYFLAIEFIYSIQENSMLRKFTCNNLNIVYGCNHILV